MSTPDVINGLFECLGGAAVFASIRALYRAKRVSGFSPVTLAFFTSWGYWNLYFYPTLGQLWSTVGAVVTVVANSAYLFLMWKYRRNV